MHFTRVFLSLFIKFAAPYTSAFLSKLYSSFSAYQLSSLALRGQEGHTILRRLQRQQRQQRQPRHKTVKR